MAMKIVNHQYYIRKYLINENSCLKENEIQEEKSFPRKWKPLG